MSLSLESRGLRLAGIALVIISFVAFAIFENTVDPLQRFLSGDAAELTWVALVCLLMANVFALGIVLLLAGLRELSLLRSAPARRGALARMGAANLMLLCFFYVALTDSNALGEAFYTSWYVIPSLIAFILVARLSILLFRSGWKHEARTAHDALAADPRPPVVYLRSFGIDDQILVAARGLGGRLTTLLTYTASVSPEQEMAFILERVGPVIAIGKPGEKLPQLGAARLYVSDEEWRAVVGKLMNDAALVVIRAGETANLWWEVQEALTHLPRERVIIVALGTDLAMFEQRFIQTYGVPNARPALPAGVLTKFLQLLFPYGRSIGNIIHFDRQGKPWQEPLCFRFQWSSMVLAPYRPYRDSLQLAFKAVFEALGLRWIPKRSLTGAVLLALFGGILGLHHFYVGNRRQGTWYLAFCWLAFPMVLGWIDSMRLAMLDETQFQQRVQPRLE
ncbi:MAG TPA: TM2 domain-containing protein [Burkholderiales bacterium]|nr:TM2 domain-containing protein [Burkholderiales bacterium]